MSSISNSLLVGQLQVAVAKRQLQALEQQGQDALALIQSAASPVPATAPAVAVGGPPPNTPPNVGTALNLVG